MKFISGSEEYFLKFLEELTKNDKIGIYCHNDLDGIVSAIIIKKVLEKKGLKIKELNFIQIGKDAFKIIDKTIEKKKLNKLILCDLSIDADLDDFEKINKKTKCIVFDHHPSERVDKNIIRTESKDCCTFALYSLFKDKIDLNKYKELVAATIIAEITYQYDESFNFLKELYSDISKEKIFESIPGELSKKITSCLIYFDKKEKKVFNLILKEKNNKLGKYQKIIEKEICAWEEKYKTSQEFFPKKKLHFYYGNPKFGITSIIMTKLSLENPNEAFVFVSNSRSKKDIVKVSCRNSAGIEDVNALMKKAINGLENGSGGGHIKAAGGQFMKKDLQKFKENLLS